MNLRIEENIDEGRLRKGMKIYSILNKYSSDQKNAIIGYKWFVGDTPENIREELKEVDEITALETLTAVGVCFLTEEEFIDIVDQFSRKLEFDYDDHQAWSVFTALEASSYKEFDNSNLEAFVYEEDSEEPINSINIDLINDESPLEIFTCKFAVEKQKTEASDKVGQLKDWFSDTEEVNLIGIGTFSLQKKERVNSYFSEKPDEIITGFDLLEMKSE